MRAVVSFNCLLDQGFLESAQTRNEQWRRAATTRTATSKSRSDGWKIPGVVEFSETHILASNGQKDALAKSLYIYISPAEQNMHIFAPLLSIYNMLITCYHESVIYETWIVFRRVLLVCHKNKWRDLSQKLVPSLFLFIEGGQENIFIGPKNIFNQ